MLRQWGPRHCVATSILRNCRFNCCTEQSHKDNVRSTAVEKRLKQKTSQPQFLSPAPPPCSWSLLGSPARHHHPPLDLAWTRKRKSNFFVRVQLTSLLLISPGPANESLTSSSESSSPPSSWSRLDPQMKVLTSSSESSSPPSSWSRLDPQMKVLTSSSESSSPPSSWSRLDPQMKVLTSSSESSSPPSSWQLGYPQ